MKKLTNDLSYKLVVYRYDLYFVFCISSFVKNIETDAECLSNIDQILSMENFIK